MSLASFTDANAHLDKDKVQFHTADEASDIALSIDRFVRGRLNSVYGEQVTLWDYNPTAPQTDTPEMIREIAAMLMAAKLYNERYSLEDNSSNTYGSRLWRRGDELLDSLIDGSMTLVEVEVISGTAFSQDDFWPNDTTGFDSCSFEPKFWMDMPL